MRAQDIDKIAGAVVASLAGGGGVGPLGCGAMSSTIAFDAPPAYACTGHYECGGMGRFYCPGVFDCATEFECPSSNPFTCGETFKCDQAFGRRVCLATDGGFACPVPFGSD